MKTKINYILFLIFIFVFCINLTGCMTNEGEDLPQNETYSLVSSQNRLVFKKSNNYEVYYMGDNIVTKIVIVKARIIPF